MLLDLLRLECAGSGTQHEACIGGKPRQGEATKKENKKETKKAKYDKPVSTKFKKLTDVVAGESHPIEPILGCTRF